MTAMNRSNAPHFLWGQACDGWRLLDGDDLSVIEERMPPKTSELRHIHGRANQLFYVLRGELMIDVDGQTHALRTSDALNVRPGEVHRARNDSATEDVRFLVISAPSTRGDRDEI